MTQLERAMLDAAERSIPPLGDHSDFELIQFFLGGFFLAFLGATGKKKQDCRKANYDREPRLHAKSILREKRSVNLREGTVLAQDALH
jgi:hypothetical protein